jgi:hypothetical protein
MFPCGIGQESTTTVEKYMSGDLVRITSNPRLSFDDLKKGEASYPQAYKIQIQAWLLKPVDDLSRDKETKADNGMAAFAVLLMFFEPHGEYLTGNDRDYKSNRSRFCKAFDTFLRSLTPEERGAAPESKSIWTWARCGLFHSTKLDNNLLVDTINCGTGIFTTKQLQLNKRRESKQVCLVNPWRMRKYLERYVDEYCRIIEEELDEKLTKSFHITFQRLLGEPMKYFCG